MEILESAKQNSEDGCSLPLREQLAVKALGKNEYRGKNLWSYLFMRSIYGGQLMGQALKAAFHSMLDLDPSFVLQSYHCYFTRRVEVTSDIFYKVEHVKVGSNFCSLVVKGIQDGGVVFHCLVSFHKSGLASHELDYCTQEMPVVSKPTTFIADVQNQNDGSNSMDLLQLICQFTQEKSGAFDIMYSPKVPERPTKPKSPYWIRTKPDGMISKSSDHQTLHRINLIYASDFILAGVGLAHFPQFRFQAMYSLDHSMWFYGQVRDGNWYLHSHELEHSVGGRTLNSSRIFSEDGELMAICKQECVLRFKL